MTPKSSAPRTEFKFVGAHLDDLADGRILEPGTTYLLDQKEVEDTHNAQRIEAGLLIETASAKERV